MHNINYTVLSLLIVGCTTEPVEPIEPIVEEDSSEVSLVRFQDCNDTRSYMSRVVTNQILSYQYGSYGWGMLDSAAEEDGDSTTSESSPSDYTTTNNQEEGVDEIDLVKTDGQYLYIAQDKALHIVDSWPLEEATKLATVELDGWSSGLFLNGDKLVVASQNYEDGHNGTRYSIINIEDRSNPITERTIEIDGYQADARMIGDDLYFVLNHWLYFPSEVWNLLYNSDLELPDVNWNLEGQQLEDDIERKRQQARFIIAPVVHDLVQEWDLDEMLPQWRDSERGDQWQPMHSCEDIYRPREVAQFNMLSLFHVDIETDEIDSTGIMSNGWTVYASQENLYVAQTSRWWWWGWGNEDLSTNIHKFSLNSESKPEYKASGKVDGWIYDQFAMSEYDGNLRVASTSINWGWGWSNDDQEVGSNIFVLQDTGKSLLAEVGSVTGIAPGEQIFACRMMGEKGYLVTFEQTDPLFTIDLADPSNPTVVGELHIPGFSTYLHPLGDDHLLAVGRAGDEDGNIRGMAINVFDVSDFANPTLAHQFEINDDGWSWSEALWEHHAFTFHRDVLTIPAYSSSYDEQTGDYDYFSGSMSFAIDTEDGIDQIGTVDHRPLVEESECLYTRNYNYSEDVCNDWAWYANVRRNVYIEDNLLSISNYGVRVTDLNDPSQEIRDVLFYPQD